MALPTIVVKDGGNIDRTVFQRASGRQAAADSQAMVLSTEDLAAINALGTPLSAILDALTDGPAVTELQAILSALLGTLTVQYDGPQAITGTLDAVIDGPTFPGYKPGDNVTVVDGSARIVRVARHLASTGSAETVAAANPNRVYLELFNSSNTDQWYRWDGTAAVGGAGSLLLKPYTGRVWDGARVTPTGAISVICGTPDKVMSVWEG